MITAWTKHLKSEEDVQRFKKRLQSSSDVIERIQELMKEDEESLNNREVSPKVYDLSNWDYRQADANGYRRCLREYQKLLTLDQKD